MNINLLSELLRELVMEHDRVSLPGMGSFIAEHAPSVFSDKATVLHPPFRRIMFRSKEVWNDGILASKYAEIMKIGEEEALDQIESFTGKARFDIEQSRSMELPGFGTLRLNDRNGYTFVIDKESFISKSAYGLEPVNIKVPSRPGTIEQIRAKAAKSYTDEEKIRKIGTSSGKESTKVISPLLRNILIIAGVIMLILILAVVFSEQLRPVWEMLLYNKEERELLKMLK